MEDLNSQITKDRDLIKRPWVPTLGATGEAKTAVSSPTK